MDLQIVFFSFVWKEKSKMKWPIVNMKQHQFGLSCHLLVCQISEVSHYYYYLWKGGNVQRLSNSMIMSSLFCPLEFFSSLACHRHLWNSALRNGPWAGKQMPSSHYFYVVLNPRVSLMGGEKKKDGYFPIAIYSELITTSLEGTKPEEQQSKLNDDDFFFSSLQTLKRKWYCHAWLWISSYFQPQVQQSLDSWARHSNEKNSTDTFAW